MPETPDQQATMLEKQAKALRQEMGTLAGPYPDALTAEALRRQQWQPISSAPKDGTKVHIARKSVEFGWILGWGHYVKIHGVEGWIAHGYGPFGELGLGDPTHWQPLPDPPAVLRSHVEREDK